MLLCPHRRLAIEGSLFSGCAWVCLSVCDMSTRSLWTRYTNRLWAVSCVKTLLGMKFQKKYHDPERNTFLAGFRFCSIEIEQDMQPPHAFPGLWIHQKCISHGLGLHWWSLTGNSVLRHLTGFKGPLLNRD